MFGDDLYPFGPKKDRVKWSDPTKEQRRITNSPYTFIALH